MGFVDVASSSVNKYLKAAEVKIGNLILTFIIEPFILVVSMPITNQSQTQGEHSETTLRDRRFGPFLSLSPAQDQVLLFLPSKTIPIFGFLLSPLTSQQLNPNQGYLKPKLICHSVAQYPLHSPLMVFEHTMKPD